MVLAIAYAVLIPMKVLGMLPCVMTWTRVLSGPPLMVGQVPAYVFMAMRFPKRMVLGSLILVVAAVAIVLMLTLLDSAFQAARP